jgi:hypothetical protein
MPKFDNDIDMGDNSTVVNVPAPLNPNDVATKTYVDRADDLLAPLDSPGFIGIPTAPTAQSLSNDNQIATTAYVDSAVVDSGGVGAITFSVVANSTVLAYSVVVPLSNARVQYDDNMTLTDFYKPAWLTLQSISTSTSGVVCVLGQITNLSWNWTTGEPIYLGTNGTMTQTVPLYPAFSLQVAVAITSTTIFFDPQAPVNLLSGSGAGTYTFVQASSQSVWGPITHGLGVIPSVVVTDSAGTNHGGFGRVDTNVNTTTLYFTAPFSGTAELIA